MPGNFSIGDELSELVRGASRELSYDQMKKTWPKYFAIGTLVVATSIMALAKSCTHKSEENQPALKEVHPSSYLIKAHVYPNAYTLLADNFKGTYTGIKNKM